MLLRHTHTLWLDAPLDRVRPHLTELWSGGPGDAFPYEHIRPWRRPPEGASGFVLGTRFGHGAFAFVVDRCDDREVRGMIEIAGYLGHHGFTLHEERGGTRVVHDLRADVAWIERLKWKTLVGPVHDWAVITCLARLAHLASGGTSAALPPVTAPFGLTVLNRARALARRARAQVHGHTPATERVRVPQS